MLAIIEDEKVKKSQISEKIVEKKDEEKPLELKEEKLMAISLQMKQ